MNKTVKKMIEGMIDYLISLLPIEDENGNPIPLSTEEKLTIRKLEKKILERFEKDLETFRGEHVIQFPMVFDIFLNPDDFKSFGEGIPGLLPELVAAFYGVIKEKRDADPKNVVRNTNRYWLFTFSPSDYIEQEDGTPFIIPKGDAAIQASLIGEDIRMGSQNPSQPASDDSQKVFTRTNVTSISSLSNGTAFNLDVLAGGYWHANGMASFNFDSNLPTDIKTVANTRNSSKNVRALLSWFSLNTMERSSHEFQMMETTISISGTEDPRDNSLYIMKINDSVVKKEHVQIRFTGSEFQICTFYEHVLVAEKELAVSERQNPQWVTLPNRCSIVIANSVTISFDALT